MNGSDKSNRRLILADVVDNINLAPAHPGHFKLILNSQMLADQAIPGQFIHVLPPSSTELLRRPFSICKTDPQSGHVSIIFRVIAEGTSLLASTNPGDTLDLIGPLGNGFPLDLEHPAILAGGGVGIPPLVFLAKKMIESGLSTDPHSSPAVKVFLGARDESTLICVDDFRELGIEPIIATEDGSIGTCGLITDSLAKIDQFDPGSIVYSCGPLPMLKAIAKWSSENNFKCWVSMENKLACGIGACLGCSIPIREKGGSIHYERVCCDGPVFDASRVAFDLM